MLDTALLCYGTHRKSVSILITVFIILTFSFSFWGDKLKVNTQPRRNILVAQSDIFQNLLKKNVSSFSDDEFLFFLSFKENQYKERRVKIKEFCSIKEKNFGKTIMKYSLIFDRKDGVSYCQIAKVASSTWCDHFIKLGR